MPHPGLPDVPGGYSSNKVLVQLTTAAHRPIVAAVAQGRLRLDGDPRSHLRQAFRDQAVLAGVTRMRPLFTDGFSDPALAASLGLNRYYVLDVPTGSDTPAIAADMAELADDVESASVDAIGELAQVLIPNDTAFSIQWSLNNTGQTGGTADADIDAPEAWSLHTGTPGSVTIAIIDSGVSPHPEFGSRLLPGRNVADLMNQTNTNDQCPHGTHVAGIAAAQGHNNQGIAGINWGANILPVRVTSPCPNTCQGGTEPGTVVCTSQANCTVRGGGGNCLPNLTERCPEGCGGTASALAQGIKWAADNGADVANMSLQYGNISSAQIQLFQDAADYAHGLGVLLVAANGNNEVNGQLPEGVVAYPAKLRNTLAISATTDDDLFASDRTIPPTAPWRSNWGPETDLCAPGDAIFSTWTGNSFTTLSGTSMATPHVAGVAALLMSFVPTLSDTDVADILLATSEDKGAIGWDDHYGYGRINAFYALSVAQNWPSILSSDPANHAIDAGQPTDALGFGSYGYEFVDMAFPLGVVAGLTTADFRVLQKGGTGGPPGILAIVPQDEVTARIVLSAKIKKKAWTTILHNDTGIVHLGYLPGDVNGNAVSTADDVKALVDSLSGTPPPLPPWSGDLDRSGMNTPLDILTCINLLKGADAFEVFLNASLP
ncbi:MAG: S8 family serine peptidase [Planctomycetota bacterium]